MLTQGNKVLFLQPLIREFGIKRTVFLQDMMQKLDDKLDASKPCSVTAVLSAVDQRFANAEQDVEDPCIQFILAKLLADIYAEKIRATYKAKGWSAAQIDAQVKVCMQMEHAIRYQLKLTPTITEPETKLVPEGMIDQVMDALENIKNKIDAGETEGFEPLQ